MSLRQFVSALVLVILTALPVSGSVCALLCDAAKSAGTGHHGSAKDCEEPAPSSTGVQIRRVSDHDCRTHDAAIRQASLTAAEKANASVKPIPLSADLITVRLTAPPNDGALFKYTGPPGTAPPTTTTPLVLRI